MKLIKEIDWVRTPLKQNLSVIFIALKQKREEMRNKK